MMKVIGEHDKRVIQAFAYAANKHKRKLCLGDVCVDDDGKAFSHLIHPDGSYSKYTLTRKRQLTFNGMASEDLRVATEVFKEMTEGLQG